MPSKFLGEVSEPQIAPEGKISVETLDTANNRIPYGTQLFRRTYQKLHDTHNFSYTPLAPKSSAIFSLKCVGLFTRNNFVGLTFSGIKGDQFVYGVIGRRDYNA